MTQDALISLPEAESVRITPTGNALAGIRATEDFYKSLGMPSSLKELGVEEERLEEMAVKCTNMGKRTLPGIRELGKEEMMEIYRMAMGE